MKCLQRLRRHGAPAAGLGLALASLPLLACGGASLTGLTPTVTPATGAPATSPGPSVLVGGSALAVEVASDPETRARGLSGRDSLPDRAGMLFLFESGIAGPFWMQGMRFPLDIVWIGADCTVVDVTLGAPPPATGTPAEALPLYSPSAPAAYVLELNAGEAQSLGVSVGAAVRFLGVEVAEGRCGAGAP